MIPIDKFHRLVEIVDEAAGVLDYDRINNAVAKGTDELVPAAVTNRLILGENPIRVLAEAMSLTIEDLLVD